MNALVIIAFIFAVAAAGIICGVLYYRKGFKDASDINRAQYAAELTRQKTLFDESYNQSLEKNNLLHHALLLCFVNYINLKTTYYRSYKTYKHLVAKTPDTFVLTISISKSKQYSITLNKKYYDLVKAEKGDTIDMISWSKISSLPNLILDNKI